MIIMGVSFGMAFISGLSVWIFAPEVGGVFWPYILFAMAVGTSFVAGKIVFGVLVYAFSFYFIDELFTFGNADDPWGDAEVENFMEKFEEDE